MEQNQSPERNPYTSGQLITFSSLNGLKGTKTIQQEKDSLSINVIGNTGYPHAKE